MISIKKESNNETNSQETLIRTSNQNSINNGSQLEFKDLDAKNPLESTLQKHINTLLQNFALMQSIQATKSNVDDSNLLDPSFTNPTINQQSKFLSPKSNQWSAISNLSRENPMFAQYIAMIMAAFSESNLSSSTTSVPNSLNTNPLQSSNKQPIHDVVVKQGNSRCSDCNIVFYKHENYLVHKKLYCASRRNRSVSPSERSATEISNQSITLGASNNNNNTNDNGENISNSLSLKRNRRPSTSSASSSLSFSSSQPSSNKFSANLIANEIESESVVNATESLSLSASPSLLIPTRESVSASTIAAPGTPTPSASSLLSPNNSKQFQYFCAACGIKYTSYDNLHAHQTYYCLKRNNAANPPQTATTPISSGTIESPLPSSPISSSATPQSLLTPRLLAVAAAAASLGNQSNPTEGFLDFSSPTSLTQQWNALVTAAAAVNAKTNSTLTNGLIGDYNCHKCKASYVSSDTLAAHVCSADIRLEKNEKPQTTPSSAASLQTYKCTICGYKGHTMRGMRTHVRVHTEELAATGAFEEEFIVQNTDLPEPSIGRRSSHGNSLTNPARQRRRSHNIDPQLFNCHSNSETMENVLRTQMNSFFESSNKQRNSSKEHSLEDSSTNRKTSSSLTNSISNSSDVVNSVQNHNCQFCPYTSNYKGNVIRHIKLVHKEINGCLPTSISSSSLQQPFIKEAMDGLLPNNADLPDELNVGEIAIGGGINHTKSSSLNSKISSLSLNGIREGSSPSISPSITPNHLLSTLSSSTMSSPNRTLDLIKEKNKNSSMNINTSIQNNTNNSEKIDSTYDGKNSDQDLDSKYCSVCNISFTYRNSYLAHKRYYCSSHTNET